MTLILLRSVFQIPELSADIHAPSYNSSSNKIQKRIENLESEQDATVREKQELQKKQKTLEIIQQNFTALLDAPEINSDLLPAKRKPVSVTRDK